MSRPKGTGGKAKTLTIEEIRRIDRAFDGPYALRDRTIMYWGLGTGMRISETVGLYVRDVAANRKVLSEVVLEKHSTKGRRSRTVYVSIQAQRAMELYLRTQKVFDKSQTRVFQGIRGPITAKWAGKVFHQACIDAGIPNATSHSLRRTHANTMRRNGVDLRIIQEQLGHSRLTTTATYLMVDPVEAASAVRDLHF